MEFIAIQNFPSRGERDLWSDFRQLGARGGGVLPSKRTTGDVPLDGGRIFTTGLTIMGLHF